MKGRGLVVVLALILATVATAGVFLYTRGVQEQANQVGEMVPVVVSKVDIPARTDLNQLIQEDQFKVIEVPEVAVVSGAITSVDQLADKNNAVAILAGEQIPEARITGNVVGGALSIPEGMEAITMSIEAPRAVAGALNAGDQVTIYSTFKSVPGKGVHASSTDVLTSVLIPTAQILAVYRPFAQSTFGNEEAQAQASQVPGSLTLTLALTPDDAQRFVFAMEMGSTWLALLPPKAEGPSNRPISWAEVVK